MLINLLQKFEVIALLKSKDSAEKVLLIPTLLPVAPSVPIDNHWPTQIVQGENEVERDYEFDFLPIGVFGRIMVRLVLLNDACMELTCFV